MFLVSRAIAQRFTNLLDTFASYAGKGGYILRVKTTEDGVEGISIIDAAGMVSGAALTLLANIAAGAGVIPIANIPTILYTKGGTGLTALGTALQVLRTNAAVNAIEWGAVSAGDMSYADTRSIAVAFSRDTSIASGTQDVSVGGTLTPKGFIFIQSVDAGTAASWGVDSVTSARNFAHLTAGTYNYHPTASIQHQGAAGTYFGKVSAVAAGQFTISWTKGSSPTETIIILALVLF